MADDKKKKDVDLDAILSEINATINKDAKKVNAEEKVEAEVIAKPKVEETKEEKPTQEEKLEVEVAKSKSKKKKDKKKDPAVEATKDTTLGKTATEDSLKENRSARFIEVTSAEIVEELKEEPEIIIEKKGSTADHREMSRDRNPQVQKLKNKKVGRSKRQKRVAIIGAAMTLFCIVGIVASVWGLVNFTSGVINNTAQKEEIAKEIFPFVIIDIPEFDNPTKLDNAAIISAAIWEFIIDEPDKSKYDKDDLGGIYVPAIDIEPYIRRLFGNDVKIKHQAVDDTSVQMSYDAENKVYTIESTPKFLPYRPRVDKIQKSGDVITLKVSYILPDAMWDMQTKDKVEKVGKTMEYKVKKNKTGYQLLSVKLLSVEGISSSSNVTSEPEKDTTEETSSEGTTSGNASSEATSSAKE